MEDLVYEIFLTSGKSFYVKATHELVQEALYPNGDGQPPVRNQYIYFPICQKDGDSSGEEHVSIYIGNIEAIYCKKR
jgi:hypothetical protein